MMLLPGTVMVSTVSVDVIVVAEGTYATLLDLVAPRSQSTICLISRSGYDLPAKRSIICYVNTSLLATRIFTEPPHHGLLLKLAMSLLAQELQDV